MTAAGQGYLSRLARRWNGGSLRIALGKQQPVREAFGGRTQRVAGVTQSGRGAHGMGHCGQEPVKSMLKINVSVN